MKPTRNRIFCKDSGKHKMVFETEKKANTFIRFNSEEIEQEGGYAPIRSYFCIYCGGWHVTSKKDKEAQSKTEKILDAYQHEKEQRLLDKSRKAEIRKENAVVLNNHLSFVEQQMKLLSSDAKDIDRSQIIIDAVAAMEKAKLLKGEHKRKKDTEEKLMELVKVIF